MPLTRPSPLPRRFLYGALLGIAIAVLYAALGELLPVLGTATAVAGVLAVAVAGAILGWAATLPAAARGRQATLQLQHQRVVEGVHDVLYETDAQHRWTFLNPAWEELTGLSPAESLGRPFLDFVHPDDRNTCRRAFASLLEGEESCRHETRYRTASGEYLWIEVNACLLRDEDGRVLGTTGRLIDVTARREAEDRLRELAGELERRVEERTEELGRSEQKFRALIERSSDCIIILEPDGTVRYTSPAIERILGWDPAAVLGRHFQEFVHPDEQERAAATFTAVLADGGEPATMETRVRTHGGGFLCLEFTVRDMRHEPAIGGIVANGRDVTERNEVTERLRQSERDYHGLFENAQDAILILDPTEEVVLDANPRACEVYGLPRESLVGSSLRPISRDPERGARMMREALAANRPLRFETVQLRADGEELHLEVVASVMEYRGCTAVLSINRDITERKRTEEALRTSEERFRQIAENIHEVFYILDIDAFRLLYVSPAYEKVWGRSVAGALENPVSWFESVHPEDAPRLMASMSNPGQEFSVEYRVMRPDGEVRWIWGRGFPVRDETGRVYREVGISEDITARKVAEAAMQAAEARAQGTAERMRAVAAAAAAVIGAPSHAGLRDVLQEACRRVVPFDAFFLASYDPETGVFSDIGGTDSGILVAPSRIPAAGTPAGRVLEARRSLVTLSADDPRVVDAILTGTGRRSESAIRTPILAGDKPLGILSIQSYTPGLYTAEDVEVVEALAALAATALENLRLAEEQREAADALRESQQQLLQAQKMEAVGRLAGGVAHDFNNMLMAIQGHTELLRMEDVLAPPLEWHLDEIASAVERASGLTRQLLAFSRKQVMQPRSISVNIVVTEMQSMLARMIGEDVTMHTVLTPALGSVLADPTQLQQVLLNLAVNARDAMPGGGILSIETANVQLHDEYAATHAEVRPGRYVLLAVSDTGVGMDAATRERIFEPFFTTKEQGKGTGLGLSTVYGIVRQSGGHISVYSEPGLGTTFRIYFPRIDAPTESLERAAPEGPPPGGSETVLLVEDDALVRSLLSSFLDRLGYRVVAAARGEEALVRAEAHDGPVHLLLTDVVMPGMSGRELARRVREVRLETRVLYMSGYTDEAIALHGVLDPGTDFVQKPISPDDLARKLRTVLDRPRQG